MILFIFPDTMATQCILQVSLYFHMLETLIFFTYRNMLFPYEFIARKC